MKYFIEICEMLKEIKETDWFSKNDLFVTITIDDQIRRTTVKWNHNKPVWNEQFIFDIDTVNTSKIILTICDEDSYSKSETLIKEEKKINLKEIIEDTTKFLKIKHGIFSFKLKMEYEELKREYEKLKVENVKFSTEKKALEGDLKTIEKNYEKNKKIIQTNNLHLSSITSELNSLHKEYANNIKRLQKIVN